MGKLIQKSNSNSKIRGPPHSNYLDVFLSSEEPSLEFLRSAELQCTNSSPISRCRCSKSAILFRATPKILVVVVLQLGVVSPDHTRPVWAEP